MGCLTAFNSLLIKFDLKQFGLFWTFLHDSYVDKFQSVKNSMALTVCRSYYYLDTFWVYVHLKKPNVTTSFIILPLFLPLRVLHHCHLHGYQQLYVRIILSELKEMQKKSFFYKKKELTIQILDQSLSYVQ